MSGRSGTSPEAAGKAQMSGVPANTQSFSRIGNDLSADFANTCYSPDRPEGSLRSGADVLAFLVDAQAIGREEAATIRKALAQRRNADARLFQEAVQLRAAVRDILHALADRASIPVGALRALNAVLAADAGFEQIEARPGKRFQLVYRRARPDIVGALAPIARAASRLLLDDGSKIRRCANPACVRYFYDSSRTGRRRWCEMSVCGNRAKVTAFLKRRRRASSSR